METEFQKRGITARKVVLTSFLVNISDVSLNVIIAILSGSAIILSQALQGVSDLVSTSLLLVGISRSNRPSDKAHPFGYGRELYFWTLIAALLMFAVSALLSIYNGITRIIDPVPVSYLPLSYLVLLISVVTNSYSFSLSFRRLVGKHGIAQIMNIFFRSNLVETKITFVQDLMGVSASFFGLIALALYGLTGDYRFDGIGAIIVGLILAMLTATLIIDIKGLVVGKSASPEAELKIRDAALSVPQVLDVLDLRTMMIGMNKILVNIEVHLQDRLTTDEIELLTDRIKAAIAREVPSVKHLQVELESPGR